MTITESETTAAGTGTPRLNKALSQLQGELPPIKKTKTAEIKYQDKAGGWNSHKYSYADLGDVVADIGPLLAKHGLAFHCAPTINPADRREMLLLWSLLHESGEEKSGEWPLGPVNQKPQSLGSAITYGRRYCFTAATNIVLEDDDDGQRAQADHGGAQEAGDVWAQSTPAPPRRAQQDDRQAAAPEGGRSWADDALRRAKAVKSDAEAATLIRETTARHIAGDINRRQQDQIQNTTRSTLRKLRAAATPVNVEDLARAAQDSPQTARGTAAAGNGDPAPDPAGTGQPVPPLPGEDNQAIAAGSELWTVRHRKLAGIVWQHLHRLGYPAKDKETDEEKVARLADVAKLAGVSEIGSTNDLDLGELSVVADTLARCKDRKALDALLKAGEVDG